MGIVQDTKMTRMYGANGNGYPLKALESFLDGQGKGRYVVDKQYEYALYSQHHNGWLKKIGPGGSQKEALSRSRTDAIDKTRAGVSSPSAADRTAGSGPVTQTR